ncbi:MAG: hypothetical protein CSA62_02575 [Planctomycetota bacterium]|nr:MAG: hypothetical protein CSA62_02575 [Planctomycetota bacterium]
MDKEADFEEGDSFAYSGRIDSRSFFVLPFFFGLGLLAALLYQVLLDIHDWVLLNVFLPPVLGAVLGVIGVALLRTGQLRNARLAFALLLGLVLVSLGWAHLLALGVLDGGSAAVAAGFEEKLTKGDPIPGTDRFVPPGLLLVAWAFEALVVLWLGTGLAWAWWRRAVFSEGERRFLQAEPLIRRYTDHPKSIQTAFENGGLSALQEIELLTQPASAKQGELRLRLYRSPEGLWLNAEWRGLLPGPRGRKTLRNVLLLRRIRVSEEFLARWLGEGYTAAR